MTLGTLPSQDQWRDLGAPPPTPVIRDGLIYTLSSKEELTALAAAAQLDTRLVYFDPASGSRYWAVNESFFITAGLSLDLSIVNYVESGLVLPTSGTLTNSVLASGVAYVEGNRIALPSTILSLTANQDNYIDLRRDGIVVVSPVAVAGIAPAIPVNAMRLGFLTTNATNITARSMSAFDNQGNWMFNTSRMPACKLRNTGNFSGFGGVSVPVNFELADVFDNANMHSPTPNPSRIVFNSPGMYALSCSVQFLGAITAVGPLELACYVSNLGAASAEDPTFPKDTRAAGTANVLNLQTSGFVQAVAAGDYAEFYIAPNGAAGSLVAAWLTATKIG